MPARKFTVEEIAACYNRNGGNARDVSNELGVSETTIHRNLAVARKRGIALCQRRKVVSKSKEQGGSVFLALDELSKIGVSKSDPFVKVTVSEVEKKIIIEKW